MARDIQEEEAGRIRNTLVSSATEMKFQTQIEISVLADIKEAPSNSQKAVKYSLYLKKK